MSGPVTGPGTVLAQAPGSGVAAPRARRARPVGVTAVSIAAAAVAGRVVAAEASWGWHRFAVAAVAAVVVLYAGEIYHRTQSAAAAAVVAFRMVVAAVITVRNPDWVSYPTGPSVTAGLVGW